MGRAGYRFAWVCTAFGFALFISAAARGGSVTADYSANHVALHAQAQSKFIGPTVTDSTPLAGPAIDSATSAPPGSPHPPFRDAVTATSSTVPAGGGLAKDLMNGTDQLAFLNGTAASNDTFTLAFNANGSAVNAKNSIGENAAGQQAMEADLGFFVDINFGPTPVPAGTIVGQLKLPPVRNALTGETIIGKVLRDSVSVLTLPAGSPGGDIDLVAGHSYKVQFDYTLDVPHGVDPATSFTYTGTLTPEPAAALALLPLVGVMLRRRYRHA